MGSGRFTADDWTKVRTASVGRSTAQNFKNRSMPDDLNPRNIKRRESRDSTDNPESTPIMVGADLTGSMGDLANTMLTEGCATLTLSMYDRKPVTDPHLMFLGIGDVHSDSAPLQMTQFEANAVIADQLKKIYVEGNGGGNNSESYHLPWYAAAFKVDADSFKKRGRKGFIFTYGDESVPPPLTPEHIARVFGDSSEESFSAERLLKMIEREWHVFHLIIEEGHHMRYGADHVKASWKALLGERAVLVSDHKRMPEIIVSLAQVVAGQDAESVINSWSGDTSLVVRRAVAGMSGAVARTAGGGVNRL